MPDFLDNAEFPPMMGLSISGRNEHGGQQVQPNAPAPEQYRQMNKPMKPIEPHTASAKAGSRHGF